MFCFIFCFFFKYLYTLYYEIALIFQISALLVDLNKIALVGYLLDKMNDSIHPFVSRTDIVNLHYTAVCHGVTCSPTTHTHTHTKRRELKLLPFYAPSFLLLLLLLPCLRVSTQLTQEQQQQHTAAEFQQETNTPGVVTPGH